MALAVLAAGRSKRMPDQNKLLLPFPDVPIVRCSVERAIESDVGPVGVVVASSNGSVAEALGGLPVELLVNPDAEQGAATSVRRAAKWALEQGYDLMLTLADEPTLDPSVVRHLKDHWMEQRSPAVRTRYEDRPGHPVVVSRSVLLEAAALEGDAGFGRWLQTERVHELAIAAQAPIDIDEESDYQAALARLTH